VVYIRKEISEEIKGSVFSQGRDKYWFIVTSMVIGFVVMKWDGMLVLV
jgi:hypothetical protein